MLILSFIFWGLFQIEAWLYIVVVVKVNKRKNVFVDDNAFVRIGSATGNRNKSECKRVIQKAHCKFKSKCIESHEFLFLWGRKGRIVLTGNYYFFFMICFTYSAHIHIFYICAYLKPPHVPGVSRRLQTILVTLQEELQEKPAEVNKRTRKITWKIVGDITMCMYLRLTSILAV